MPVMREKGPPSEVGGYKVARPADNGRAGVESRPMTRLRRIEQLDRIFFVTFNVERGVPLLSPHERSVVLEILDGLRTPLGFMVFGYAVMPDHAHLLLWPRKVPLTRVMRDLKSRSGYAIAQGPQIPGAIWQRSYFDFICRRAHDFGDKLGYIHRNPVEAGLVSRPDEWQWSSFQFYARAGPCPVIPDKIDFSGDPDELLLPHW